MNPKDIRESSDPDLAGSYAAMMRAARAAEDLAIKTNTCLVVSIDGVDRRLTAEDLKKMRSLEAKQLCVDLVKTDLSAQKVHTQLLTQLHESLQDGSF